MKALRPLRPLRAMNYLKKKISGKSLIVNSHFQNMGKIEKMEESR